MQFTKTLFTSGLMASSAFAGVVVKRDLALITNAMVAIGKAVVQMTNDINSWDGQATSAVKVLDDSKAIQSLLTSSSQAIKTSDAIGLFDAINILSPTTTLTNQVDGVVQALIAKKSQLNAANLQAVVLQELKDQKFAANDLASAIVGRLPSLAQAIGGPLAQQIVTKLDNAVNQFSQ